MRKSTTFQIFKSHLSWYNASICWGFLGTFRGNLLSLTTQTGKGGGWQGRRWGVSLHFGDLQGCHGNPPQLAAEAAGLRYLQGNSRGRGRDVFGVASTQRTQLPQYREEEWGRVTKTGDRDRAVEIMQEEQQREKEKEGRRAWGLWWGRVNIEEKIKRGQEHCGRKRTNHLQRKGGSYKLCGVRDWTRTWKQETETRADRALGGQKWGKKSLGFIRNLYFSR